MRINNEQNIWSQYDLNGERMKPTFVCATNCDYNECRMPSWNFVSIELIFLTVNYCRVKKNLKKIGSFGNVIVSVYLFVNCSDTRVHKNYDSYHGF